MRLNIIRHSHGSLQVRHREAAHVVKKTKVSLLPLLPHANENQLGQLAQVGGLLVYCFLLWFLLLPSPSLVFCSDVICRL